MDPICSNCQQDLPHDGIQRKRNRPRRCPACIKKDKQQRLVNQPEITLAHRWGNTCRKHWPDAPTTLYSQETVKYVMDRFERKSAISGEANMAYLCVYPYYVSATAPDYRHLVLVTAREAQSLARCKTQEDREARYPQHIREMMVLEPFEPSTS